MEGQSNSSNRKKRDVKKRKKDLEKQNSEYKQGIKKRKETAKDRLLQLNSFYANGNFGIWIQCTKCDKWRKVMEYEEEYEVPDNWCCSMSLSGIRSCDEPENVENVNFSPVNFIPGTIVWAKYNGYPWWPGMIEDDPDTEEYYWKEKNGKWLYNVTFLDDKVTRAWVSASSVRSFLDKPKNKYLTASYAKYSALLAAAEVKAKNAMNMSIQERLKNFSFAHQYKGKWGSPLALDDSDEDDSDEEERNGIDITKMLLDEVIDIDSIEPPNSDNKSVGCQLKQNESDHESVHEISSTSDFEYEINRKKKEKLLIKAHSKVTNQDNVAHPKIENDKVSKTETNENAKTSVIPKGKKVKNTHVKLEKKSISESNNDVTFLDKADADENIRKDVSKKEKINKKMNTSKMKNKKDNKIDDKEETRSSLIKTVSEDAKTFNENEKNEENREEEILNHSLNSKFKPPVKDNEINACKDDEQNGAKTNDADINLDNSESFVNEETFVKEEMSEKNRNKIDNKGKKKPSKKFKISENKSIEKNTENENELKENIVKVLEKNLKNTLESMPMKENKKKEDKKNHLKEDLDNSNIPDSKNYTKRNKSVTINIQQKKNVLKVDSSTEELTNIGKSKIRNGFKIPTRQDINKKESKGMKNLKTEKFKKETDDTIQENGFACASDEEVKKDDLSNNLTEEKFSLSVKMNLQETEDEDSDPFEAE